MLAEPAVKSGRFWLVAARCFPAQIYWHTAQATLDSMESLHTYEFQRTLERCLKAASNSHLSKCTDSSFFPFPANALEGAQKTLNKPEVDFFFFSKKTACGFLSIRDVKPSPDLLSSAEPRRNSSLFLKAKRVFTRPKYLIFKMADIDFGGCRKKQNREAAEKLSFIRNWEERMRKIQLTNFKSTWWGNSQSCNWVPSEAPELSVDGWKQQQRPGSSNQNWGTSTRKSL